MSRAEPLRILALSALVALTACDREDEEETETLTLAGKGSAAQAAPAAPLAAPKIPHVVSKRLEDPNPLGLPPRTVELGAEKRVFTFSDRMLAGAKEGSTLVLYAATAVGLDGDLVVIEGRDGPDYKVHAGYVIPAIENPRIRLNEPVLTDWAGVLQHGVVARFVKDKVVVSFTDMRRKVPERSMVRARVFPQKEGLAPGNYAAQRDGQTFRHLLLVSPFEAEGKKRWFALGYAGAATLVDEESLVPIPLKPSLKEGAAVWAEWLGTLRPATVTSNEGPGEVLVKFARAGRPARLGFGLVMPPLEGVELAP